MIRPNKYRPERIAALVQGSLANALATELKDPRIGFATVTGVAVTPDLAHATVRVSVMGNEEQKAQTMQGLSSAKGFLRTHLARTLTLRTAPELHFVLDRGLEHALRINELLDELNNGGES